MVYGMSYPTNAITGHKRKRHRNQLWWKHRTQQAMTPGEQVLSEKAQDQAYLSLQLSLFALMAHQLIWQAIIGQMVLETVYQMQGMPRVTAIMQACRIMRTHNQEVADRIFMSTVRVHFSMVQLFRSKMQMLVNVKGALVNLFLQMVQHFVRLLSIESNLMDLPLFAVQGRYALPMRNIRLLNYMNVQHADVHVTSKYRFKIAEIRELLQKLQLPQFWRVRRHNVHTRVPYYVFNSKELLLYLLH